MKSESSGKHLSFIGAWALAFGCAVGSDALVMPWTEFLPRLMLDPQRLRQIVFNLVGNAVKFTEKGFVELCASYAPDPGRDAGFFRVEVEDTGCGISQGNLVKLGSAYVQVGRKSKFSKDTGLGLAICRQLAETAGGRLEMKSEPGKGSVFSLCISGVKTAPAQGKTSDGGSGAPEVSVAAPAGGIRRILMVDDANMNLMVLKAIAGNIGDSRW